MAHFVKPATAVFAIMLGLSACGNRPPGASKGTTPPAIASRTGPPLSITENSLMVAAEKGDTAKVQSLLDQGLNVNLRDSDGRTPLTEAVYAGRVDTVKLLLARGADVNAKKNDGATPLTLTQGNKEIMDLLQKKEDKPASSPSPKGSPASASSPSPSPSAKTKKH